MHHSLFDVDQMPSSTSVSLLLASTTLCLAALNFLIDLRTSLAKAHLEVRRKKTDWTSVTFEIGKVHEKFVIIPELGQLLLCSVALTRDRLPVSTSI